MRLPTRVAGRGGGAAALDFKLGVWALENNSVALATGAAARRRRCRCPGRLISVHCAEGKGRGWKGKGKVSAGFSHLLRRDKQHMNDHLKPHSRVALGLLSAIPLSSRHACAVMAVLAACSPHMYVKSSDAGAPRRRGGRRVAGVIGDGSISLSGCRWDL